jgi:hypothetical protein
MPAGNKTKFQRWRAEMKRNRLLHLYARPLTRAALAGICLAVGQPAHAQQANTGGSPLDTLMHTKIWADVPEAKDFVRETLPPPDSLAYQPVTGTDPERPKLRSKTELEALESELERAASHNDRNVAKRAGIKKPAPAKTANREQVHADRGLASGRKDRSPLP